MRKFNPENLTSDDQSLLIAYQRLTKLSNNLAVLYTQLEELKLRVKLLEKHFPSIQKELISCKQTLEESLNRINAITDRLQDQQ